MTSPFPNPKPAIHWIFFWASGVAVLFVWNAVVSQSDYLKSRFDSEADKIYPAYFKFGGMVAFLLYTPITLWLPFRERILLMPSILVALSISIFYLGEYFPSGNFKLPILLGVCFLDGFFSSILQTALFSYSFKFTYFEITYVNSGNALIAIVVNCFSFILDMSISNDNLALKALLYLVFQITILTALLIIFAKYCMTCKTEVVLVEKERKTENKRRERMSHGEKPDSIQKELGDGPPSLLSTLKIIHPFFFHMILVYTVTLGVFPGFLFDLGLGWNSPAASQVILLSFNISDCLGKLVFSILQLKDNWLPQVISIVRVIFPLFVAVVFGSNSNGGSLKNIPALTLGFTAVMALSNGYMTSALFSLSAARCDERHKNNAGFLMTFAMNFGLLFGALCVAFGTSPS